MAALFSLGFALLLLTADTPFGRTAIERVIAVSSFKQVLLSGLEGNIASQFSIRRLELHDATGPWLTFDEIKLEWQPLKLLAREAAIARLQVHAIMLERWPVAAAGSNSSAQLSLPLNITLDSLMVDRFEMATVLAGEAAAFSLIGRLKADVSHHGNIDLLMQRLEQQGVYSLNASLTDKELQAQVSLHETAPGPLAKLAGLDYPAALNLDAEFVGPLSAINSHLLLKLGELEAQLVGEINWPPVAVNLSLMAKAPAMKWDQELSWQALMLNLQFIGPMNKLNMSGGLQIDRLNLGQTLIGKLAGKVEGADGNIKLDGELAELKLASYQVDLLQAEPLRFQAKIGLDRPDLPCSLELNHRLLIASGLGNWQANLLSAELNVNLPDLQAIAAYSGLQAAGSGLMLVKFSEQDAKQQLEIAGKLHLIGDSAWAKLLGAAAKFDLSLTRQNADLVMSGMHLLGKSLSWSATGGVTAGQADFNWLMELGDFSALMVKNSGHLTAQGRLLGSLQDFSLSTVLTGELASKGHPGGQLHGDLQIQHLPDKASGQFLLNGELFRAPVAVELKANSPTPKTMNLIIEKAEWKSLHARGGLLFSPVSLLPVGKVDLQISHLADFQAFFKESLVGSLSIGLDSVTQNGRPQAKLMLSALNAGMEGEAIIGRADLALNISDPAGAPGFAGMLNLQDVRSGGLRGSAQLKLAGELAALNLHLTAAMENLSGNAAHLSGAALLNLPKSNLLLSSLQADWRQQNLSLLTPAKFVFKNELSVDNLRLGLKQAELDISGRFIPDLALHAELQQTSAELLSLFAPEVPLIGRLHAITDLKGSVRQPRGLLRVEAEQLRMKNGVGLGLPPANLTVNAQLQGESAEINVALKADQDSYINVAGHLPFNNTGLFALHGTAAVDLKQLDPLLNAKGWRARGKFLLENQLAGTWSAPLLTGSGQLKGGEWQDFSAGIAVSSVDAGLEIVDGRLSIVKLQARAGPGSLSVAGNIDLFTQGMPINLSITARNARPLASDQLTVNLDADLLLEGLAAEQMTASGAITVIRADIRIPERMPAGIAVLKIRHDSLWSEPPAATSNVNLNLLLKAPSEIFLRGRGVDAELGGSLRISGDMSDPRPEGEFKLRNGKFTLAGQMLVFNQGSIGFYSNNIRDPSLNFVANTNRNNITATIVLTGSPLHPDIVLSSVPILPQDEILANLLFGKGSATLSPLEMAQIAATLASLTGVGAGIGDPLDSLRKRIGLDRLSAGGVNPSLEAGRYIAPGVYLGARQGVSGGSPQPIVQIDLTKHLKLEGGVGSGAASSSAGSAATNSVGVIYQFEY